MAFRAVHAQWGTVFAHLPDLGCGQTWEAVWKVRPPVLRITGFSPDSITEIPHL